MFHMSHPPPPVNGGLGGSSNGDGFGTINPAALNTPGHSHVSPPQASPRGTKRSRSPDVSYDPLSGERLDDDDKPRKRGRPPKALKVPDNANPQPSSAIAKGSQPSQTPQPTPYAVSQASPSQASPGKTPTKPPVLKALPTVRDHTSNELNEGGDEYLPREFDEAGEKKVAQNGALLGSRQYRCRTFYMPNRGDKLFMLATECAKVLNYRDSYLLFNKNRSLYKIIANQIEKNDLIQQDILPSSYRSRQIAIVTARSMYRQFGSRLVVNGRRVRDDYWESKARKQGFTEDDPAGEKRPGAAAAKAREAAAAAAEATATAIQGIPQGPIVYSNTAPNQLASTLPHLPMIQSIPDHDLGDYSAVQRPRHDITGTAYQDKTQPSGPNEIMSQATQTAEYNQNIAQQRLSRSRYLDNIWRRPHEQPPSPDLAGDISATITQAQRSPQQTTAAATSQQNVAGHQTPQHTMVPPPGYPQSAHSNMMSPSPSRPTPQQLPGGSMQHRSPSMPMGVGQYGQQYGYPQNMWSGAQSTPNVQAPLQYPAHMQQPSPHMQQNTLHPAQLHQGAGGMPGMGYNAVPGNMNHQGYGGVPRQMYQSSPTPQQYMQPGAPSTQPGMQSWQQTQSHGQPGQQNWQNFQ